MQPDTFVITAFFLCLIAGFFDGTAETLKFHPFGFFHVFKNAKVPFWDMNISWKNKYKNNDPSQGPKFWQSTKALVFWTDGYHRMRWFKNISIFLAVLIMPDMPEWYQYPIAFILCYLAYTGGFAIVYDHLFGFKEIKK
jgi:hypothetical protein